MPRRPRRARPTTSGAVSAPRLKHRWSRFSARPRSVLNRSRNSPFPPPSMTPTPRPAGRAASRKTGHDGDAPRAISPTPWSTAPSDSTVPPADPLGQEPAAERPGGVHHGVQEVEDADPRIRLREPVLHRADQRRDEQAAPADEQEGGGPEESGRGRPSTWLVGHPPDAIGSGRSRRAANRSERDSRVIRAASRMQDAELRLVDGVAGLEREPAGALGDALPFQDAAGVVHEDAVLEPEMDVLLLGPDEAAERRPAPGRDVIADQPPAGPDGLDGVGERAPDDAAQPLGDVAHRRRVPREQRLGWQRVHAAIIVGGAVGTWHEPRRLEERRRPGLVARPQDGVEAIERPRPMLVGAAREDRAPEARAAQVGRPERLDRHGQLGASPSSRRTSRHRGRRRGAPGTGPPPARASTTSMTMRPSRS